MTYKEHIEKVVKQLRSFANNEVTDLILLRNHLDGILDDISSEVGLLKWECDSCGNTWKQSPLLTFEECPECESEDIGHY